MKSVQGNHSLLACGTTHEATSRCKKGSSEQERLTLCGEGQEWLLEEAAFSMGLDSAGKEVAV